MAETVEKECAIGGECRRADQNGSKQACALVELYLILIEKGIV
jgi:hypothetical protein